MSAIRIGTFEISTVLEQELPSFEAKDLFPDLTDERLNVARTALGTDYILESGMLMMAFRTFVLRTGKYNVLIDTCVGNHKERPERPLFHRLTTPYLQDLAALGLKPEQIDFVMCTHLHWDHVGWNTQLIDGKWIPTFPNAKYIISKTEYDYWDETYRTAPEGRHAQAFKDSIAPVVRAEQALLVDDGYELQPGISLEACTGHTIGTYNVNMKSQAEAGAFCGDVLQHPIQLVFPDLSSRPDYDQARARVTRGAFLERHADTGNIVMPTHFPYHPGGRIERDADAYKFTPA